MTLPTFTLIGRPNVGKSTLFNALTQTRDAIVADMPGVTRDRQYGIGKIGQYEYLIVDTGGIVTASEKDELHEQVKAQVQQAIEEADRILFVVDAEIGLVAEDLEIAKRLRPYQKKTTILINKVDKENQVGNHEFFELGFASLFEVSARARRGLLPMMDTLLQSFPVPERQPWSSDQPLAIAIIGRPNVGKSTLVNRLLGEDRVIVLDQPGTTRDSIYIPFERRDKKYTLIDTAGMRRRAKIEEAVEQFSVVRTLQAIDRASVVLLVMDAKTGITEQDMRLLGLVVQLGKALVIALNKWDGLDEEDKDRIKDEIDRRLQFVSFARRYWISALHGSGLGKLFHAIHEAHQSATQVLSTSELTKILQRAVEAYQPPLVQGFRVRMRYAHLGGHDPMVIVIHGKRVSALPLSYQRYLINYFRKAFKLVGVPLQLRFKQDANPYSDSEHDKNL